MYAHWCLYYVTVFTFLTKQLTLSSLLLLYLTSPVPLPWPSGSIDHLKAPLFLVTVVTINRKWWRSFLLLPLLLPRILILRFTEKSAFYCVAVVHKFASSPATSTSHIKQTKPNGCLIVDIIMQMALFITTRNYKILFIVAENVFFVPFFCLIYNVKFWWNH